MRHYEIKGFSRFSRFLAVFVSFSYFSSYFATTENQVLHAYKDWTGLISKDVLSSADIISSEDINESVSLDVNVNVSLDISEDMTDIADMAVSNDIPASSDNDSNDNFDSNDNSFVSFDSLVSHDTNDTGNTADTEADTEEQSDMADSGNTVGPVASGPDEENNDNTPNNENNDNNPNNPNTPDDSESIAVLTTRLTSDHHLIATLSISGVMGADVAVFPNTTGPNATGPNTGPDEFTSAGGNIYTVSNNAGSSAVASLTDSADIDDVDDVDKPDSLLLNFENEEGVVESVRLWLDNEIDETVILDGISIPSDDTINTISNGNDNGNDSNGSNFSSRTYDGTDGSNGSNNSQSDLPRLAVPLSEAASSDLAASTDTATAPSVWGHSLESFIGLDQLASPIIVILPSTNEQYYFANGKALAAYDRFDQDYRISDIRATTRAEIEVRLVRK